MSIQQIIKAVKSLNYENDEILALKKLCLDFEETISKRNKQAYDTNLEESRQKRKINNSKQAIRKVWSIRKVKKDLIKKHIKILKEMLWKKL